MIEWLLILVLTGGGVVTFPAFEKQIDCMEAGMDIVDKVGGEVSYVCIRRPYFPDRKVMK